MRRRRFSRAGELIIRTAIRSLDERVRDRLVECLLEQRLAMLQRLRASRELTGAEAERQHLLDQLAALGLRLRALARRPLLAQVDDERDFFPTADP